MKDDTKIPSVMNDRLCIRGTKNVEIISADNVDPIKNRIKIVFDDKVDEVVFKVAPKDVVCS